VTSEVGDFIAGTSTTNATVNNVSTEDPNHLTKVALEMAPCTMNFRSQELR
jgi:hypothetical protein